MILLCVCFFFPTKSNLSLIHGPNIPGSYAMLFFTALNFTSFTCHIHNWALFSLWLHVFIISEAISPLFAILGIYRPGKFIFQYHIFLPFHTFHGVLKARILKWLDISFCSGHVMSDLSTMTCPSWVARQACLGFIELDKAVVLV